MQRPDVKVMPKEIADFVVDSDDNAILGPHPYDGVLYPFIDKLKELYEPYGGSIPLPLVEPKVSEMSLYQMQDELRACIHQLVNNSQEPGDMLIADLLMLLEKFFVIPEMGKENNKYDIDTACIRLAKDPSTGKYKMHLVFNTDFFFGKIQTRDQRVAILRHEMYHVLFNHLSIRRQDKQTVLWNIAQDLAINSLCTRKYISKKEGAWVIDAENVPSFFEHEIKYKTKVMEPDEAGTMVEVEKEVKANVLGSGICLPLIGAFKAFPPFLSSEEYYAMLQDKNKTDHKDLESLIQMIMEQHDWFPDFDPDNLGDIPEEADQAFKDFYEAVKTRVRDHINNMKNSNRQWGVGDVNILEMLQKLWVPKPNWASLLAGKIASIRKDQRQTWMRPNRRGQKGVPAIEQEYKHSIRIYIDQSGSMSDEDVAKMYQRIFPLIRHADVTIYHFDYSVDEASRHVVKTPSQVRPIRTRSGGTNFQAVADHYKSNKRDTPDLVFIMTDMGCPPPENVDRKIVYMYGEHMSYLDKSMVELFKKSKHTVVALPDRK